MKLCECGCGLPTPIASRTRNTRNQKKGQPLRFINGHNETPLGRRLHHGHARRSGISQEYRSYRNARDRCTSENHKDYAHYGGRGIKFLFASFEAFLTELGLKPTSGLVLDRINNNGHYEPGNVRWATLSQSNKNKRYHPFTRKGRSA